MIGNTRIAETRIAGARAATGAPVYAIVGAVAITVGVASTMSVAYRLAGEVPVTLVPSAPASVAYRLDGEVPVTLVPSSPASVAYRLAGEVPVTLVPSSPREFVPAVAPLAYLHAALALDAAGGAFFDQALDDAQLAADAATFTDPTMGYGNRVTHAGGTFNAILVRPSADGLRWSAPQLIAASGDVTTLTAGDALTVDGEAWTVAHAHQPDGTGFSRVPLVPGLDV